jgi:enoyl-CoA hydratase/carnithine racemase
MENEVCLYARREMSGLVLVRLVGDVAVVEMNRPDKRNAMDTALLEGLVRRLKEVASDTGASAAVITGAGGAFSSGADLSESVSAQGAQRRMRLFAFVYEIVTGFSKPTVAAITGACVGGGAEVAAACDLRVGAPAAAIKFPGAQFGIPVGTARLEALVGLSHAKDLLMTSRTFKGEEAFRIGFFNRLIEDEQTLEPTAIELAASMATNPGSITQKRLLDEATGLTARVQKENRELVRWQRTTPQPR